jgi:hypothetical protein
VLEEPLDAIGPFEENQTKCFVLRINPLAMKRRWRGMSIKRNKNTNESQHVKTLLSFLPLDQGEVVQHYFPPAHEVEETTSLNDEEIEDPIEATPPSILSTHEDTEMVIFSHTDGHMKETLEMVNEHIDTFIHIERHTWDFGHFIFDRDPIYDNEGSSQAKGVELSPLEDWSSCVYDSYVWKPDDDMVIYFFCPFKDDLS